MPICVFDIFPDGTARAPEDDALTGPGAYRWWHYDLTDPAFQPWVHAHLPPIPAGSLLQDETRPRCDRYESGLMLNLRGINMNEGADADEMISVRMWVDEDVLVTVRRRRIFAIDEIRRRSEAGEAPAAPCLFLEELIGRLTLRVQGQLAKIEELVDYFEADLDDRDTPTPRELPDTRRSVIRLRRYLEPQRAALTELSGMDIPLIPLDSSFRLREWANRSTIAVEELDALRDQLVSIQDEHDALVAQRQARHGYVLSIIAAIFLPLGFITGLFGVNVGGMPGIDNPMAFAVLCLSMVGLAAVVFLILKWLRWF
jgi:zinc transporter